jgi:hypothetical protein
MDVLCYEGGTEILMNTFYKRSFPPNRKLPLFDQFKKKNVKKANPAVTEGFHFITFGQDTFQDFGWVDDTLVNK